MTGVSASVEVVRLVDAAGRDVGTADKETVHSAATPLHLAFSCHVLDPGGRILLTRRSLAKKTWPGVWTNSFCGHPAPDESFTDAIHRRAAYELGMHVSRPSLALPDFRYQAVDASGIMENEVCPVYRAEISGPVLTFAPNPAEVCDWAWVSAADLSRSIAAAPFAFSPWLVLQLQQGLNLGQ